MLGEFRILRKLGQGGMAQVYLADQTSLGRKVAIKVLRLERIGDDIGRKRFQTEATAAAALNHPNIVAVYLVGEQDGRDYIAQEYVPGGNLRELITRKGPPELDQALQIIRQTAQALQAAHNAGIVHRDIKPENILLTSRGDAKVADFGLAQLTQQGERVNLTQDGMTMGTPLYMSPEQVRGSKLDPRSDLYSLGVTCYHMLSGSPPFRGKTPYLIAMQHAREKPAPLSSLREDLPPVLCRIVHKMMAKDPDKRYQSATELLRDLKRLGSQLETGEPIGGDEDSDDERSGSPGGESAHVAGGPWPVRLARRIWRAPDHSWSGYLARVFGLAVLVAGVAAGAGWLLRTPDPLASEPGRGAGVENQGSADRQYFYAMTLGDSIPAWQAVVENYPENRLFKNYAIQQLAKLHLARGEYEQAGRYFDDLAALPSAEAKFRATGKAGQAILMYLRRDYQGSQDLLSQVASHYRDFDRWMQDLVADTIQRNREQLNEQLNANLRGILNQQEASAE